MMMIPRLSVCRRMAPGILAAMTLVSLSGCQSSTVEEATPSTSTPSPLAAARSEAEQHLAAGKVDAAAGDFEGAVEEFTVALNRLRPADGHVDKPSQDVDILFQRGLAWLALGFPDTAAEDFTEVLRQDRDSGAAYAKRGQAYVALGDGYRAVRDCTEAIRFDPSDAAAYRFRGLAYLGRRQFERATIDLEQAIDLDPSIESQIAPLLGKAYYGWSRLLAAAGDDAHATVKLARAQELNTAYVAAYEPDVVADDSASPASALARTAAKPVIDEAVEHFSLARGHFLQGRYDEAIIEFTEAIALDRTFVDAYVHRAEALIAAGFPDTALKDLAAALRIDEMSEDALRLQALAFASLGSYHRTAMSATEALHVDPSDARMYALRGEAYWRLRNPDRAIADLEEAIRRSPELESELRPMLDDARTQLEQ